MNMVEDKRKLTQKEIYMYGKYNENMVKKYFNGRKNWSCIKANEILDSYCKIDLLAFRTIDGFTTTYAIQVKGWHSKFPMVHKERFLDYCEKKNYVPWLVLVKNGRVKYIKTFNKKDA